MTLLAIEFPPVEFLIFAVAILLGIIGKIVEFAREVRRKSIETEEREHRTFGEDLGEAPEPPPVEINLDDLLGEAQPVGHRSIVLARCACRAYKGESVRRRG